MRKFMRTRSPPPPPPHAHANGVSVLRDELHSSLSRCGGGSQSSGGGAAGGAGSCGGAAGGALFEDDEFPASRRSLGDSRLTAVRWRRPHELSASPRFLGDEPAEGEHDDPTRWAVELGALGDARLAAAAGALAATPRLLQRAAPPHSFRAGYTGAFRFRFWVFGAWREVRVDDRLPERGGRLLAARPAHHDYTLPLLEKAYAKLYGSYGALRGGSVARALQDLTGGVVQSFSLQAQPRALSFQVLNSAVPRSTLLVASARAGRRGGLRPGRPYCVAGLARVRGGGATGGAGEALVRVRAPAGGAWAGAWSPASAEWRALAAADRDLLAASAAHPQDFWMSFNDFVQSFSQLELVHVGPDDWLAEPALQTRRPWRAVLARRRWRRGYNAGGPPGAPTAAANPQFHVQVPTKCHVVVSVTQQYSPAPAKLRAIGFAVYEAGAGRAPLDVTHESRAREVVTFFTLPAGRYLVVPHTRRPHTDAAFLLRILTDEQTDVWEVNEDNVIVRDVAAELEAEQEQALPASVRAALARLPARGGELDAAGLRAALRRVWRACLCARPSLELCRALVPLRDRGLRGCMRARELPALVALLAYWRGAFLRGADAGRCGAALRPAYALRGLLWAAGVTASNKVLECLVLRFARGVSLSEEGYVMALARLHLAHERYRSLDTKIKSNPLSLEEMILMTIYS